MIAALFSRQPHLMQRLLTVDNDLTTVLKAEGQHAAVDFAVDIAVAIPVIKAFFNGEPQGVSQAMKFTVVHCRFPFFVMAAV
ncbi:hypothetical protein SEH50133_05656 [Salmonella enterica subsp. houtenae serovar 50:g,z51:- str. 01-0133]|nr:hypothetical protein SEH50133_05656 [Salmonella enterica subsp. houtenae serovar 50:g,z51:- str. 01-0133]